MQWPVTAGLRLCLQPQHPAPHCRLSAWPGTRRQLVPPPEGLPVPVPVLRVRAIRPVRLDNARKEQLRLPAQYTVDDGPVRIHEGALLFVTSISCNYKDSPYKREWEGE